MEWVCCGHIFLLIITTCKAYVRQSSSSHPFYSLWPLTWGNLIYTFWFKLLYTSSILDCFALQWNKNWTDNVHSFKLLFANKSRNEFTRLKWEWKGKGVIETSHGIPKTFVQKISLFSPYKILNVMRMTLCFWLY